MQRGGPGTLAPAMQCPFCHTPDTRVVDSRASDGGAAVRRRRECQVCSQRFTTYERVALVPMVRKRSGDLATFDPGKLRTGVERALADRPVPVGSVDDLVADIEQEIVAGRTEVTADELGNAVLERLRKLDEVAYVRFASVYKEFQGAADFEREVAELESVTPHDA